MKNVVYLGRSLEEFLHCIFAPFAFLVGLFPTLGEFGPQVLLRP